MEVKQAFQILGTEPIKDESCIRQAYRALLSDNNPEDNPEGFKRLRQAYETALQYARTAEDGQRQEEKTETDIWMEQVEAVYRSFSRRMNPVCWQDLLRADVCQSLADEEEVRAKLFGFLAGHFRLLPDIWRILDEHFLIEEEKETFEEHLPAEFVRYMLSQIHGEVHFPYEYFEGRDDADYDAWTASYFQLYEAVEEKNIARAEELIKNMEGMEIRHPLAEMERARIMMLKGEKEDAFQTASLLLEKYPDEIRILILGSGILWECGEADRAAANYEKIHSRYPDHYVTNLRLGNYYAGREEYKKAKEFISSASRVNSRDPDMLHCLKEINRHLIEAYQEKFRRQTADMEDYIEFGWCCLQNEENQAGIDCLSGVTPDEANETGYHSVLERLYFAAGIPEKAEEEGNAWIQSIRREEPSLPEEEKLRVPERIAAAYYIMGRAWMQVMQQEEHALKLLETSIAFYDKNADAYLQKALLLNRMKRFREAGDACDRLLELEPENFWGYVNRMEAFLALKEGQGVIDDFYRAKKIFAAYPPLYEMTAEVFDGSGQFEDVLDIIKQAEHENISTPKLSLFRLRARSRQAKTRGEAEKILDDAAALLAGMEESRENAKIRGEIYAEAARVQNNLGDGKAALAYINRALAQDDRPFFKWMKGSFLFDLEKYQEALKILQSCEKDFPEGDMVMFRIGECFHRLGKMEQAAAYLNKTLEIDPENGRANSKLAEIYRDLLEEKEDLAYYEKALVFADRQLELRPEAYYYVERGLLHMAAAHYCRAVKDFEEALRLEPENVYAHNNICVCCRMLEEYEKAIEAGKKAEHVLGEQDKVRVYGNLGDCYMETGCFHQAEEYYLKHQKQFPGGRSPKESLIEVYIRLGNLNAAFYWIGKAYEEEQEVLYRKAQVYYRLGEGEKAGLCLHDILKSRENPGRTKLLASYNAYYLLRKEREALKMAKSVLKETKAGTEAYFHAGFLMAEIYMRNGKQAKAQKTAQRLMSVWQAQYGEAELKKWKYRRRRLYELGILYLFTGQREKALEQVHLISDAVKCEDVCCGTHGETCAEALHLMALICEFTGKRQEALTYYTRLEQSGFLNIQANYGRRRMQ